MSKFDFSSFANGDRFSRRIEELRSGLRSANPLSLSANTGSEWQPTSADAGLFKLALWNRFLEVHLPDWVIRKPPGGEEASQIEQALILYYFTIADGFPIQGRWISFSDLPDGRFYVQAFQGYTGEKIAQAFQNDLVRFQEAAMNLGGTTAAVGDVSFEFWALPRVPVLVAYWRGDEDFPASARVLFDASVSHYLTTDACAILGSTLTRRLIGAGFTHKP